MTAVRRVLLIGILIGLVVAFGISFQDNKQQRSYNQVLTVLDYTAVLEWSDFTGQPVAELLTLALNNNIGHIALSELELTINNDRLEGFFSAEADVTASSGRDIQELQLTSPEGNVWVRSVGDTTIEPDNIYLYVASLERAEQLYFAAATKYGQRRVARWQTAAGNTVIELKNSTSLPINGLGIDPAQVEFLQNEGFSVIPRPINAGYTLQDASALQGYFDYINSKINPDTIIFAGKEGILGMPVNGGDDLLSVTTANLRQTNESQPLYGHIEMTVLEGDRQLAEALNYKLARVHSIGSNEWLERYNLDTANSTTVNSVVQRYLLAVNDRSVHILYLRPFMNTLAFNEEYFKTLTQSLIARGYQLGSVAAVPVRQALLDIPLSLLAIGIGCASLLLLLQFFPKAERLILLLLVLGVIGVVGMVFFMPSFHSMLQKLLALTAAVVFPVLAILDGYVWMKKGLSSGFLTVMVKLLMAFVFALIGALYVHAVLATANFMTSIEVFPLVKVALLAPAFILALLLLLESDAHNKVWHLLNMNVKMYHVVLGGVAVAVLGILVMRSGNNPIIAVTNIELKVRLWLQQTLIARPRFKEFIIGYPLLMMAAWLQYKHRNAMLFLLGGVIGLSSMVNTFAHLHKPLWMALLTTINGLWAGIIVGALLIIAIEFIIKLKLFSNWGELSE